jgi:hypothetical protein
MAWSEQEVVYAKQLQEPGMKRFLEKIFTELKTNKVMDKLEQTITIADDAQYGQLMKAHFIAKEENKHKLALINTISKSGVDKNAKPAAIAPR